MLRLLEAMCDGKSGWVEHSGKSGDRGIDGIMPPQAGGAPTQDPLELARVYMQVKSYARYNVVQRPAIQAPTASAVQAESTAVLHRALPSLGVKVIVLQRGSLPIGVAVVDRFAYTRTHDRQVLAGTHLDA